MQLPGADETGPLGRGLQKLSAALGDDAVVVELPRPAEVDNHIAVLSEPFGAPNGWTCATGPLRGTRSPSARSPRDGSCTTAASGTSSLTISGQGSGARSASIASSRLHPPASTMRWRTPRRAHRVEWFADGGLPQVVLRLDPAAAWVVERYPVDRVVELDDGALEATFPLASERWLERLLVRLGDQAEVLAPEQWRSRAGEVAQRVLARYGE